MEALGGTVKDRTSARSLRAYIVLHCNGNLDEMQDVAEAACLMTLKARERAAKVIKLHESRPERG